MLSPDPLHDVGGAMEVCFLAVSLRPRGIRWLNASQRAAFVNAICDWLGDRIDHTTAFEQLLALEARLERDGWSSRLTAASISVHPDARVDTFAFAVSLLLTDAKIDDDRLGIIDRIGEALGLPSVQVTDEVERLTREGASLLRRRQSRSQQLQTA